VRVAILRPLGLGDFLTAMPAYRGVRRHFPDAELLLGCPPNLAELANLTGLFDRLVATLPLAPLAPAFDGVDVAIDLHGRGPESMRVLLDARPARLISFENALVPQTAGMPTWRADEHEVRRWCRMLQHAGITCDPEELDLPVPTVEAPPFCNRATIIHPGAASVARQWPVERWVDVVRAEHARGRDVVLTGGAAERDIAMQIANGSDVAPSHVLAGRTSLLELAAAVHACGRVVSGDTGISHVATAYRRPSVTLFGPISPRLWGPPERPQHIELWAGESGDPHAWMTDRGLLRIEARDVVEALARLDRAAPASSISS
jgi:ADP-heptose:LPS heptosyltransferase